MDEFYRCNELKKRGTTNFYGKFSVPYPRGTGAVSASLLRNMLISHFPNFGVKSIFVPEFEYQKFNNVQSTIQETIQQIKQLNITSLFCPKPNWKRSYKLCSKLHYIPVPVLLAVPLQDMYKTKMHRGQFQSLELPNSLSHLANFHIPAPKKTKESTESRLKNICHGISKVDIEQGQLQIEKRLTSPSTKRIPRKLVQPTLIKNSFLSSIQMKNLSEHFQVTYIDSNGYSKFERFSKPSYIAWNSKSNLQVQAKKLYYYFLLCKPFSPDYFIKRKQLKNFYTSFFRDLLLLTPGSRLRPLVRLASKQIIPYCYPYPYNTGMDLPQQSKLKFVLPREQYNPVKKQSSFFFPTLKFDKQKQLKYRNNLLYARRFLSAGFAYWAPQRQSEFSEKDIYFPYPLQCINSCKPYTAYHPPERRARTTPFPVWIQFGFEKSILSPHPLDTVFQPVSDEFALLPNVYNNFFVWNSSPRRIMAQNKHMKCKKVLSPLKNRKLQRKGNLVSPFYEIDCTPVNANVQKVNFYIYENVLPFETVSLEIYTTQIISPFFALQIARGKILQNVHRLAGFQT